MIVFVEASVNPSSTFESHEYCDAELDDPSHFSCEQEVCPENADKGHILTSHPLLFKLSHLLFKLKEKLVSLSVIGTLKSEDMFRACNTQTLQTDYKRKTVLKNNFSYVEPVSICLGQNESGKECFEQYIPVTNTIESLLQCRSAWKQHKWGVRVLSSISAGIVRLIETHLTLTDPLAKSPDCMPELYQEHVQAQRHNVESSASRGVRFESVFKELAHFHVCQPRLPPCLGHKLFESSVSSNLVLYINHLVIKEKYISYLKLNWHIN